MLNLQQQELRGSILQPWLMRARKQIHQTTAVR